MKRFIFCAGAAFVMAASGCGLDMPPKKPDIDECFTAEAKIKIGSESISGSVSRTSENCWELSVAEPFALEGLTVTVDEQGTRLSMLGFEAQADFGNSALSAVRLIADAYEAAADSTDGFKNNAFQGTNENGAYTIAVDDSGIPLAITLTGHGIYAEFSEWTKTEEIAAENSEAELIAE